MEPENGINAGISFLKWLGVDLVPPYEEHSARLESRISVSEWSGMSEMEKALIIARRRIAVAVQNLQTDAEIRKMNQVQRR